MYTCIVHTVHIFFESAESDIEWREQIGATFLFSFVFWSNFTVEHEMIDPMEQIHKFHYSKMLQYGQINWTTIAESKRRHAGDLKSAKFLNTWIDSDAKYTAIASDGGV